MKILFPLLFLAACTSGRELPRPEPIIVPGPPVLVPVASPCVPKGLKEAPKYVDSNSALKAAADAAERYQLVLAGRSQRQSRLNEIEPIVAACPREK